MKGIGVSSGIAIGKVLIKKNMKPEVKRKEIDNIDKEILRFDKAIEESRKNIQDIYNYTLNYVGKEEADIFNAHLMILDDPELMGQVREKIKNEKINAEWNLKKTADVYIDIFKNMDNEYMRERASDIKDVTGRVIKFLLGIQEEDLSTLEDNVIIVAEDLTPSDTAQMDKNKVLGFITEVGGKTSHSAIMARTMEIPAVVGVTGVLDKLNNDDVIILDGEEGDIIINPNKDVLENYEEKKKEINQYKLRLETLIGKESITKDGFKVEIAANIGTPKDVDGVIRNDGEGIGLYRTEFLYMDRDKLPTEEEQFEAYKEVGERLDRKSVVIRTLDIGGDKDLPYLKLPKEMNPFLGYRAIRLCLDRVDIFKTQLRALLRASVYGNIKIMFPMISSIEELREAKDILDGVKKELQEENLSFNDNIEIGIMIEIPSSAIMSDLFAKEVDFFSIGTNDLIQYTTAVDRGNERISKLYNQFHPALLRLIKTVIENGHKEGIWVGMCGESAGDPMLIPILIGMGLDEFSMSSSSILRARDIIRNISKKEAERIVEKVINLSTAYEVKNFINNSILL